MEHSYNLCFYNFRVISSQCWEEPKQSNGYSHNKKCDAPGCCFAIYKVCYTKDADGNINLDEIQAEKVSENNIDQICESFCFGSSNWCSEMFPPMDGGNHASNKINNVDTVNTIINKICDIKIEQKEFQTNSELSVDCKQKGKVTIQFFDLLGNVIEQFEFEKKNEVVNTTINLGITSGTYLCKVNLNNQVLL